MSDRNLPSKRSTSPLVEPDQDDSSNKNSSDSEFEEQFKWAAGNTLLWDGKARQLKPAVYPKAGNLLCTYDSLMFVQEDNLVDIASHLVVDIRIIKPRILNKRFLFGIVLGLGTAVLYTVVKAIETAGFEFFPGVVPSMLGLMLLITSVFLLHGFARRNRRIAVSTPGQSYVFECESGDDPESIIPAIRRGMSVDETEEVNK